MKAFTLISFLKSLGAGLLFSFGIGMLTAGLIFFHYTPLSKYMAPLASFILPAPQLGKWIDVTLDKGGLIGMPLVLLVYGFILGFLWIHLDLNLGQKIGVILAIHVAQFLIFWVLIPGL